MFNINNLNEERKKDAGVTANLSLSHFFPQTNANSSIRDITDLNRLRDKQIVFLNCKITKWYFNYKKMPFNNSSDFTKLSFTNVKCQIVLKITTYIKLHFVRQNNPLALKQLIQLVA